MDVMSIKLFILNRYCLLNPYVTIYINNNKPLKKAFRKRKAQL